VIDCRTRRPFDRIVQARPLNDTALWKAYSCRSYILAPRSNGKPLLDLGCADGIARKKLAIVSG
jgi:hypothetical protein